jgi:type III restriction enzyme
MDKDGEEKLYFVIETKGTNTLYGLRDGERDKIKCGARHFAALGSDVHFPERPVRDWREFRLQASN